MRLRGTTLLQPLVRVVPRRRLHAGPICCAASGAEARQSSEKYEGTIVLKGPRFGPKRREDSEEVLFSSVQSVRTYDLNRPDQGNAITPTMVKLMRSRLKLNNQEIDPAKLIILRARPPLADFAARRHNAPRLDFCVGDDRYVNLTTRYVRDQYELLNDFYHAKPVVACVDGRADDLGAALALHCPFRVATTTTAITPFGRGGLSGMGMHGGCYHVLSKLDWYIGRYLALTGATVRAADAFHAGLCTVFMPRERLSLLQDRLQYLRQFEMDTIAAAINEFGAHPGEKSPFLDEKVLEVIFTCFGNNTVEDIIVALEAAESDGSVFAEQALAAMKSKSPLALKVNLQMLIESEALDTEACLELGYRVHVNAEKNKDSLRSLATLDDVTDEVLAKLLHSNGPDDLRLDPSPPLEWRNVIQTRSLDDVVRDRLLEWYDPARSPHQRPVSGTKAMSEEEKKYKQLDAVLQLMNTKKDEAGEDDDEETYMHTTLPPYGPLSMWEVMEAAKRCLTLNTYPSLEEVAKQLVIRLGVPGNAARLRMQHQILIPDAADKEEQYEQEMVSGEYIGEDGEVRLTADDDQSGQDLTEEEKESRGWPVTEKKMMDVLRKETRIPKEGLVGLPRRKKGGS